MLTGEQGGSAAGGEGVRGQQPLLLQFAADAFPPLGTHGAGAAAAQHYQGAQCSPDSVSCGSEDDVCCSADEHDDDRDWHTGLARTPGRRPANRQSSQRPRSGVWGGQPPRSGRQ
jgi:hypothetical protein